MQQQHMLVGVSTLLMIECWFVVRPGAGAGAGVTSLFCVLCYLFWKAMEQYVGVTGSSLS